MDLLIPFKCGETGAVRLLLAYLDPDLLVALCLPIAFVWLDGRQAVVEVCLSIFESFLESRSPLGKTVKSHLPLYQCLPFSSGVATGGVLGVKTHLGWLT